MSPDPVRRRERTRRRTAPVVLAALVLSGWVAGGSPAAGEDVQRDLRPAVGDAGLPAGTLAPRGLDLQAPDRTRPPAPGASGAGGAAGPATAARAAAAAARAGSWSGWWHAAALDRAGRRSAPSTGPPAFS